MSEDFFSLPPEELWSQLVFLRTKKVSSDVKRTTCLSPFEASLELQQRRKLHYLKQDKRCEDLITSFFSQSYDLDKSFHENRKAEWHGFTATHFHVYSFNRHVQSASHIPRMTQSA
jgi:hypothetical protein